MQRSGDRAPLHVVSELIAVLVCVNRRSDLLDDSHEELALIRVLCHKVTAGVSVRIITAKWVKER